MPLLFLTPNSTLLPRIASLRDVIPPSSPTEPLKRAEGNREDLRSVGLYPYSDITPHEKLTPTYLKMNHAIPIEVVNSFKEFHNALPMKMNYAIFSCSDRVVFNMVTWWRASCVCLCIGQIFSCLFFHIHYEVINMT